MWTGWRCRLTHSNFELVAAGAEADARVQHPPKFPADAFFGKGLNRHAEDDFELLIGVFGPLVVARFATHHCHFESEVEISLVDLRVHLTDMSCARKIRSFANAVKSHLGKLPPLVIVTFRAFILLRQRNTHGNMISGGPRVAQLSAAALFGVAFSATINLHADNNCLPIVFLPIYAMACATCR